MGEPAGTIRTEICDDIAIPPLPSYPPFYSSSHGDPTGGKGFLYTSDNIKRGYLVLALVSAVAFGDALISSLTVRLVLTTSILIFAWIFFAARSRSHLKLSIEAVTDGLTGLYNRRYLETRLREVQTGVAEHGGSACFAMLDIDDFKAINDLHGHTRGDEVLAFVGKTLIDNLPSGVCAFRFGGDELGLLFLQSELDDVRLVLERLSRTLRKAGISISAGAARYPDPAGPPDLLKAADEALMRAKKKGKGCIVCARASG